MFSQVHFKITSPVSTIPERRRSKRANLKKRASLSFFSLRGRAERFPCLISNRSQDGFRLQVGFGSRVRRGQLVDLILDEDPSKPVRCSVVWIGEQGSKQEGKVGLETVQHQKTLSSPFVVRFSLIHLSPPAETGGAG